MAMRLRRILTAVNGDPSDRDVIDFACTHAKKSKADIYAIYVIEVKRSLPLDADIQAEVQKGESVLEQAERSAESSGYKVETELLQARDIGTAIVDEAIERGVELIVMGLPYKTRFGEFNLGRAVPYVLKHAPCAVWILRGSVEPSQSSVSEPPLRR